MANYAYFALHKLKITPRQFDEMDNYEKAFVIASIQIKWEHDKEQEKEMKKAKRKK
jgi:hypothetical protein